MFEEAVDRLFQDLVTPDLFEPSALLGRPAALWDAVVEQGLAIAPAPEGSGGLGASWEECFGILLAAGRHVAPVPLAETLAVNLVLGRNGLDVAPSGASLGRAAPGSRLDDAACTATVPDVPWGRAVEHVLVEGDGRLALLARADATVASATSVAGEPSDTLRFEDAVPVAVAPIGNGGSPVLLAGAAVRSAQIAGAIQRLRSIAIGYAMDREQFGRPIARFQAVQHQLAVLAEQSMLARHAAEAAFVEEPGADPAFAVAVAKQVTSEAAGEAASLAHAVVGAIGFTEEYFLHPVTRRLWSWRGEFGNARFWADRIGAAACAGGASAYWPSLTVGALRVSTQA